jgi:hypothetical protein
MIFTSNFLFDLGRVLGLVGVQPNDNQIEIPARIQAVTRFIGPLEDCRTPGNGPISTFNLPGILIGVNAGSGAINQSLLTMTKGIWRFSIQGSCGSDYGQAAVAEFDALLTLEYPVSGTFITLMGFIATGAAAAPQVQASVRELEISIPVDGAIIRRKATQNAAGQHLNAAFALLVTKIL